ncbi:MAG: S9 family peptidase [Chloroflexota bacterium]
MVERSARKGLSPEDLMKFAWLEQMAITPNGDKIAFTVRRPQGDGYQVDCYLYDRTENDTSCCTTGNGRSSFPKWSHDGKSLAMVWQAENRSEIQILSAAGEVPRVYGLRLGMAPTNLDWSPNGRFLTFSAWHEQKDDPGQTGYPAPNVKVVRRLRYKRDGLGWVHNRYRHIWLLNVESGELSRLTDGELDFDQPRWSWGGDQIACVATAREQDSPLGYGQIVICEVATGHLTSPLSDWAGAAVSPQWKYDDSCLVFAGHQYPPPVHRRRFHQVWLYDLNRHTAKALTGDIDQTVGNYAVSDQRTGLTNVTVQWPSGKGSIYFLLTEQGETNLYTVDENGEHRAEVKGQGITFSYSASHKGDIVYGRSNPSSIGELFLRDGGEAPDSPQPQPITHLNPWLSERSLATPVEYWFEGLEDQAVHAWELRPVGFDPTQIYPAIVYVHCSMFSWDFNLELQCLTNAGYIVYLFNQRGTTAGYGQAHALGNYYGKQAAEFAEIMCGVDDVCLRPYVDTNRLGVTGGSCGGFLTNWIVGHTNRFAAAITQRSVTELVSKFGTSDNGPEQAISEGGGTPWENGLDLWRSSPIAYAPQIQTPLLIIHSENDHRCALSQAEALFATLRWLGRETELIVFEGESHGLAHSGRPGNRIERIKQILNWFNRYLR